MKINKYIITLLIALIMIASASGCRAKPTDNSDLTESQTTGTSPATTVQNNTDL